MDTVADIKQALGREFATHKPIEVEVEGVKFRLRTVPSVRDGVRLDETLKQFFMREATLNVLAWKIFEVMAIGSDGPLVDPEDNEWFTEGVNSLLICKATIASGVVERILEEFSRRPSVAGSEDGDAEKP